MGGRIVFPVIGLAFLILFAAGCAVPAAAPMDVITDNGPILGQTVVVPDAEPNVHVCLAPDVDRVKQDLYKTFSR